MARRRDVAAPGELSSEGPEGAGAQVIALPEAGSPVPAPLATPAGATQPGPAAKPVRARAAGAQPVPFGAKVVISALVGISAVALWSLFYVMVLSSVQEHRVQHELYAEYRANAAFQTLKISGAPQGTPIATLKIPRLGIRNLVVVEGTTSSDLELGPGHRRDTPLPGEEGTSYLLGRSTTFGGPFRRIATLRKGDVIDVASIEGNFTFKVDAVRRPGDSLSGFFPGAARLTLVSSETRKSVRQVVYVDATLQGQAQSASGSPASTIAKAEDQMQGNPDAWLPITLWLEGLVVVIVALSWVRVRWGRARTLIIGLPVLMALAWGTASAAAQLLPNLF